MSSIAISKYFDATEHRKIREDLLFAAANVNGPKIAVDCGCGAGADIDYLASLGFIVYGFDVEEEAIARCHTRFRHLDTVKLSLASFSTYNFPEASLVVADASLFFCPEQEFPTVWQSIYGCLLPDGLFCGSFLGPEDTMAGPHYNADDYWPDVLVFQQEEVIKLFADYDILRFNVHKSSGLTPQGEPHDWHIFSIVARKPDKTAT